jgi:ribosome-binding protein aMBF1 (putative translation factor)
MRVLTREREARSWSRNELARRARMAAGDVGRIEAGRLRPYDGQLRKLARALGWPIADAQRLLDVAETVETSTARPRA